MSEQAFLPNQEGQAVENPVPTEVAQEVQEVRKPELVLEGIETYADVVTQYKNHLSGLIQAGIMTEQTASTLLLESELSFFKQLVKPKYS